MPAPSLDAYEIFYYAAYTDRVFVKIHTFRMVTDEQAGCRRNGFLLKKWERIPRDMQLKKTIIRILKLLSTHQANSIWIRKIRLGRIFTIFIDDGYRHA